MLPRWYTRWVERLREQPLAVKSHVAIIGAVVLTTLIAIVWVTTLPARFSALSGAGSAVRDSVGDSLEEAPVQDVLLHDAFTSAPEPALEVPQTEQELLQARLKAMLEDTPRAHSGGTSTVGERVLIEAR